VPRGHHLQRFAFRALRAEFSEHGLVSSVKLERPRARLVELLAQGELASVRQDALVASDGRRLARHERRHLHGPPERARLLVQDDLVLGARHTLFTPRPDETDHGLVFATLVKALHLVLPFVTVWWCR
jgi:hypothetical protein